MTPKRSCVAGLIPWLLSPFVCSGALDGNRNRTIFQYQHTGWTAREGAPGQVLDLAQTTDGYLWLASQTGLFRFDGVAFEHFDLQSGGASRADVLTALLATSDGGHWIGAQTGGAIFLIR